ncbi:MAG: copper resistance CopC family protein [Nitrososphaeraceae archaeon]
MRNDKKSVERKRGSYERMTRFMYYNNKGLILSVTLLIPFAILMFLIGNLIPLSVYSHANPTSYTPQSNSVVGENGTLPEKVVIVYSERPEPIASYIRVTNSDNERVDKNDYEVSSNNPRESSISMDTSKLEPGIYTVSWLALSRDDGHITKGSYVFTVSTGANRSETDMDAINNDFANSTSIDNVNLTFEISPFYSGINNNFTITLSDSDGKAPANIKTVFLIFSNKQAGLGPISAELAKVGEGEYSGSGGYLSQPGEWEVKTTVQRTEAYDLNHGFNFDIKNPP